MLPARLAKKPKTDGRWRSDSHRRFVRDHHCCVCDSAGPIEFAHVRIGSGAGVGQKPDDWRGVPLCGGPEGCHQRQHNVGERTFWKDRDVEALIAAFCKASPKRRAIEAAQRERGRG